MTAAELSQLRRQFCGELNWMMRPTVGLNGWTWFVERQLDDSGSVSQLRAPVIKLCGEYFTLQPTALPVREVRILKRQLCQRRFFTTHISAVERRHFTHQDTDGPAIADDVMHRHQCHVLLCAQTHQAHSQQRPARQVEGSCALLC